MTRRVKGLKRGLVAKKVKPDNSNNFSFNLENEQEEIFKQDKYLKQEKKGEKTEVIKLEYECLIFSFDNTHETVTHQKDIKGISNFKDWFKSNYFRSIILKAFRVYPDGEKKEIEDLKEFSTGKIATDSYNNLKSKQNEIRN